MVLEVVAGFQVGRRPSYCTDMVLLYGISFHMHTCHYVKQVVSSTGTPVSMVKVRIEIYLLKPQYESMYEGITNENSPKKAFFKPMNIRKYKNIARRSNII